MANFRKYEHFKHENYDLLQKLVKTKSKLCFAEISFGQIAWSTFPIAQRRVASPLQWRQCCLLLNEINFFNSLWITLH